MSEHLLGAVQCFTVVLSCGRCLGDVDALHGAFFVGLCTLDMFGNTIDINIIDLSNRSNLSRSLIVIRQHVCLLLISCRLGQLLIACRWR